MRLTSPSVVGFGVVKTPRFNGSGQKPGFSDALIRIKKADAGFSMAVDQLFGKGGDFWAGFIKLLPDYPHIHRQLAKAFSNDPKAFDKFLNTPTVSSTEMKDREAMLKRMIEREDHKRL